MAKQTRKVKKKVKPKKILAPEPQKQELALEEETIIIRIAELKEEEYEQLVSHIREKHPDAEIYALQKECLFGD